jgi:hypothetical protein
MNYLEQAYKKRKASKKVDYNLPLMDFICWCYVYLTPAKYGYHLQQYICHIKLKLQEVDKNLGLGDFYFALSTGEFKSTYLSEGNSYSLLHLREWQPFKYYMFCFIDSDNNFTPEFYIILKKDFERLKLDYMNGIKDDNKNNRAREKRISVKKNSADHLYLKKKNLLKSTSFEDLEEYINNNRFKFWDKQIKRK